VHNSSTEAESEAKIRRHLARLRVAVLCLVAIPFHGTQYYTQWTIKTWQFIF